MSTKVCMWKTSMIHWMSYEDKNNNPYKWTIVPRARHKVLNVWIVCEYYNSNRNVKINYWGMKVIGTKSLASQLWSPPLIVGKIQSSKLQSSSPSPTVLTSRLLIFKGGPLARAQRTSFWALEVNPKPNLSDLYRISGSCPQMVHPPSSTTALASFRDDIRRGRSCDLGDLGYRLGYCYLLRDFLEMLKRSFNELPIQLHIPERI